MTVVRIETPILYWWEWRAQSATGWAELDPTAPPQLYTETALSLRMRFRNYGDTTKYVLPWMNVTPPSGQVFGTGPADQAKTEVPPGEERSYTFDPIILDQLGTWQAMFFIMEADSPDAVPVDMHTDQISIAVVTRSPVDITPVVSAVVGLVVIGAMMRVLPKVLSEAT